MDNARGETAFNARLKKAGRELADLLTGAAFPFMLMVILSSTVIGFIMYGGKDELGIQILILVVGEALLIAATVIFGKQNGVSAYKKTVQNAQKRAANCKEERALMHIGEYAVWKGAAIALISCVPLAVVNTVYSVYPNSVCEFILVYLFGWAYYPFKLMKLTPWLNYIWIAPFAAVHAAAYVFGGRKEKKNQEILEKQNEIVAEKQAKRGKK